MVLNLEPRSKSVLRPILADQLSINLASLQSCDLKKDIILFCEVRAETDYVSHHRQKIVFLFSAMRHFANLLKQKGYQVHYVTLTDVDNTHTLCSEWQRIALLYDCERVVVTEPGEWRVLQHIQQQNNLQIEVLEDNRFLCSHQRFLQWAQGKKQLRMEYFYQTMRKHYHLLLEHDGQPIGGRWNYDVDNREPLKKIPTMPRRVQIVPDELTQEVIQLVSTHFPHYFGDLTGFSYAVTQEQANQQAAFFFEHCLPSFGQYQDVMVEGESFLYHAVLSMYLNAGLLDPMDLCREAESRYHLQLAPLSAVEGFIRQILGWREYVRGIYWMQMPTYSEQNYFQATRALPNLYWGGQTQMNCMAQVVTQTQQNAYSHHIQRLMVTGNFALLAGLSPKQVCDWYLAVYMDAYEWVELPNTLGMALFADGGLLASKPYAASGKYIDKMSNYCKSCHYKVKEVIGDKACPFNALYWNFIAQHENKLSSNMRMKYMYATWHRFDDAKKHSILQQAQQYLEALDNNLL